MALKFNCTNCGKEIIVKYLKVGEVAKCRNCGTEVTVPSTAIDTGEEPVYKPPRRIFGMTAGQRFFVSLLLLGTIIVMEISCLLVFEKIWYF